MQNRNDGFEWTEDFDGIMSVNKYKFFFNLKFITDQGGAQTRSLRECYHFIKSQYEHIIIHKPVSYFFINILDGDTCHKHIDKFEFLKKNEKYKDIKNYIFVGDMYMFQKWWNKVINPLPHQYLSKKYPTIK